MLVLRLYAGIKTVLVLRLLVLRLYAGVKTVCWC